VTELCGSVADCCVNSAGSDEGLHPCSICTSPFVLRFSSQHVPQW
jgi:hypothetical protein